MTIHNLFGLLCAIGMFLFGIDIMSEGLRNACGERMKNLLSLCTKNRIVGVLTGFIVTAAIQSSSATTVMAVSFIDAGLLTLSQSVGVIMGANIGTTVTSLLIAVNFSAVAPLAVFIGTVMRMFSKSKKVSSVGTVLVGFGLLFVAMSSMSSFMSFFKDNGSADALMAACSGRLKSILIGFAVTAIMQSSSATVGILQSVAACNLISCQTSVYILFGQNIGAVIPTLISSIKANKEAKKAAAVHLLFNLFGTVIFIGISEVTPYISVLEKISNGSVMVSVAHVVFNVASTIILLPFGNQLAKMADVIVERRIKIIK
ncbi:MAG: Na/Pi symporter [Ruminococcus sp.]|nr:Na/Pi symporter [Ruminococcus sp.]